MTLKDIFSIAASIIISIGGAGAIIFGLSKWLGDIIANRLLDKYKFKHERELEDLKSQYQKELEFTKAEVEKSKHQFLKYSDEQFNFYNKLWKIFWHVKKTTDTLWETKNPEKIPSFAHLLNSVKDAVFENILVIDKQHSDKLLSLINDFEKIKFDSYKLIDLRKNKVFAVMPADDDEYEDYGSDKSKIVILPEEVVKEVLEANKNLKESFDIEILALADIFRVRMQGGQNST